MRNLKVSVTVQFTVYSVHCTMNRDTGHGPDKLETSGLAETSLATPVQLQLGINKKCNCCKNKNVNLSFREGF